ncbi:MAG TPA: hypothetical protein VHT03_03260 [Rhizomicrobium sp.]|jgi:hypothetical protein|nr:hypothetical protein [Rhizomicrobium sp.]
MPDDHEKARDLREIAALREQARRSRSLIPQVSDKAGSDWLAQRAEELEARADALEAKYTLPAAASVPSGEPPITEAMAALKPEAVPEPEPEPETPAAAEKPEGEKAK